MHVHCLLWFVMTGVIAYDDHMSHFGLYESCWDTLRSEAILMHTQYMHMHSNIHTAPAQETRCSNHACMKSLLLGNLCYA